MELLLCRVGLAGFPQHLSQTMARINEDLDGDAKISFSCSPPNECQFWFQLPPQVWPDTQQPLRFFLGKASFDEVGEEQMGELERRLRDAISQAAPQLAAWNVWLNPASFGTRADRERPFWLAACSASFIH